MAEQAGETRATQTESQYLLNVSADKMSVLLSCDATAAADSAAPKEILGVLGKMGISPLPSADNLSALLSKTNGDVVDLPIVEGVWSVMPTDGRLEWTGDYFTEGYYIDPETKRIDFRQKANNPAVDENQLLVVVHKAIPGKDGRDVYGKTISVPRVRDVNLRAGVNVVWSPENSGYVAKVAGRVKLVGSTLDIDEVLYVRDGVGVNSGNIMHKGQVIVDGDVESEFKVEATGNIEIKGVLQSADIQCGGNLVVADGINENLSKSVNVTGTIAAKYILNANIECEGDIIANREIFQSQIKSRGEVTCNEGRIVGGEIIAAKGITVNEVGSKGTVKTALVAGVDYTQINKLKRCSAQVEQLQSVIKKLRPVHKRLSAQMQVLNAGQKEGLTEMGFRIMEAEEGIEELEQECKEIRKQLISNRGAEIHIRGIIYPGAVLRVCDSQFVVEHALQGPLMAHLDPITQEIALSSETDTTME